MNPEQIFKRHIDELYEIEAENDYAEVTKRTVTFNFTARDAAMFHAVARRFDKSSAALGGELFSQQVLHLFLALSPLDRERVARDADAEHLAYLKEKGIEYNATSPYWAGINEYAEKQGL